MARFEFLGDAPRPPVMAYGPCTRIKVYKQNGTSQVLTPVPPATSFEIGEDIGYDITDPRTLLQMQHDPRFQQIP